MEYIIKKRVKINRIVKQWERISNIRSLKCNKTVSKLRIKGNFYGLLNVSKDLQQIPW